MFTQLFIFAMLSLLAVFVRPDVARAHSLQVTPVPQVLPVPLITMEAITHVLPTNMTPSAPTQDTDTHLFMSQFSTGLEQKISDEIMKASLFRQSALGKLSDKVEKASQTSVNLGHSHGTDVKIDFQVKVIERQVVLSYRGWVSSDLTYAFEQNNINLVVRRNLDQNTSLAWTNVASRGGGISESTLSLNRTF